MSQHLERALVLFQQSNHQQAEEELRQHLLSEPEDPGGHSLLALCLAERKEFADATREAEMGVHYGPDIAFTHFTLADVYHSRKRLDEAFKALQTAIELDPADARNFMLLSNIHFDARRWQLALEAAEQGLAIDPEHVACNNLRAMSLVQLGRPEEAGRTLNTLLEKAPSDATAHANQGWALLDKGDHRQAMEHFREALRLNPNLEWARLGVLEAMKARNFVYRQLLYFFRWMSRLSRAAQWGVILGLYFGARILNFVADKHPEWKPFVYPILGLYMVFVLLTWIANPLFNLLLRLDRFGRLTLSRDETTASNYVGGCILAAILSGAAALATGYSIFIATAFYFALLVVPISGTFHCAKGWPRRAMGCYTLGLAALGPLALVSLVLGLGFASNVPVVFLIGAIASSWVANAISMNEPKH